jgi:glycerate-2-kinase
MLTAEDLLLVLVSGGGSSLLSLPVEGVSMADLKEVTRQLLRSGAPIQSMNAVRKHLSHPGRTARGRFGGARACTDHLRRNRG